MGPKGISVLEGMDFHHPGHLVGLGTALAATGLITVYAFQKVVTMKVRLNKFQTYFQSIIFLCLCLSLWTHEKSMIWNLIVRAGTQAVMDADEEETRRAGRRLG